jgi:hypothetical protein
MKVYALFWVNGDNFVDVVIDESGNKTEDEILELIGRAEKSKYPPYEYTYFLIEQTPVMV